MDAGVLQVITRGLRKYNAAETLLGLAEVIATRALKRVLYINLVLILVLRSFNGWSE